MIEKGVNGFFERGGYLLSEDGTQYYYAGYAVRACGEAKALGNRGGGFDECRGIGGQVVVSHRQLAWAVKFAGPLRYSSSYVGNVHASGVRSLRWKECILRLEYTSRLGVDGLLLVEFQDELSVELIREAMDVEGIVAG